MKVFRAQDIPATHKIAVYDELCRHFEGALDRYYTYVVPQDPRYDSGVAAETTKCVGLAVEDGWLNVVMQIVGWAETVGFSVELPSLARDEQADEGAWIEVSGEAASPRTAALREAAAICRRRAGLPRGLGLLVSLLEAAEEIEALIDVPPSSLTDAPPAGG